MFPFMILSTLAFGVCLGRIWDALHAKWKAEEDWATQQRVAARIEAIQVGTAMKGVAHARDAHHSV